jgi:hypothetical protein
MLSGRRSCAAIASLSELVVRRESVKTQIVELGDLRPGSLKDRFRKCGKSNCHCAEPDDVGHGPSWSLTHAERGKTGTKIIPAALVPQPREQLAEYRRLRGPTQEPVKVNEKICDARLHGEKPEEDSKKRLSAGQLGGDAAAEIDSLLGRGASDNVDLEAVETAARRQVPGLAARAIERRFNADSTDYAGARLPCPCGNLARYAGRRVKSLQSALGELKLERAYYHCQACCSGFYPRDRRLGIEKTSLSPAAVRTIGKVGATVGFREGGAPLEEPAGLDVDASRVERGAEALGGRDRHR